MIVHLNGVENRIETPSTPLILQSLISQKFPTLQAFAVAVNDEIVPRSELCRVVLREGDRIEVIQAVGGG